MTLRLAIIGCGKIADQHLLAFRRIGGCEVVALCDRELLMANQLGERFGVTACFAEAAEMLRTAKPDVVHITTPPQGHFSLAKLCLEAGAHVYLEKPFTVTAPEAEELIRRAETKKLKITAGHNYQFTLEMLEMRRLVAENFLGSKTHWVRQLPGQLFHNLISHGIAKLAEFLGDQVKVTAHAHQSPRLQSLNGQEVQDELRVLLRDENGTTATFCFSTQIKPGQNFLRICGPKNSLVVDNSSGTLLRLENKSYKSYLTFLVPPLKLARQHFRNARINVFNFLNGKLHQDSGMKELIEQFHRSIKTNGAPPIPYREIILTARIMDEIFAQIKNTAK
jgi:predicted dehydrogenase